MSIATQNKFDGGKAEDIRSFSTDQCQESYNNDLYMNPHKITPIRDSVSETTSSGAMTDIQISDVGTSVISSNVYLTAVGYESAVSQKPAFYIRTSGMTGNWTQQAVGTGTYQQGSMVVYKTAAFAVGYNGSTQYTLQRYDAAGVVTTVGTTTVSTPIGTSYPVPRPFVHPEDNILYFCVSNVISKWDGTTYTNYTSILPSGYDVTSLTNYGSYLVIAMRPRNGVGKSVAYLWGRDGTINTLQATIDFGDGDLNIVENIGNILVGIVYPQTYSNYTSIINNKINIKVYSGGAVDTVKSFNITGTSSYGIAKMKNMGKLYFGVCEAGSETNMWSVYKNKEGTWVSHRERYLYDGSTTTVQSVVSLTSVGDYIYSAFYLNSGGFTLRATTTSYLNTSKYITLINPCMPVEDRNDEKQLVGIQVNYTGKSSGTIGVKYSSDGSALTSIMSESTTATESLKTATQEITNGASLAPGYEFQFQLETTGGVEIKSYTYKYQVNSPVI